MRRACDQILDVVCEKGECDLVTDIAAWLPDDHDRRRPRRRRGDRAQLLEWSDALLSALTGRPEDMEAAGAAFGEYTEFAMATMADRRENPRDDLMSILVNGEVDGDRLTDDEVLFDSVLILIGGDETTRHVISGGMFQLLSHPDQWAKLAADPDLMPGAVEEMLRWVSPIKNMNRTATRDVELRGQTDRRGRPGPAALPVGQPRRGGLRRPLPVRHRAHAQRARRLRVRHPLLHGREPGPHGAAVHGRPRAPPPPGHRAGHARGARGPAGQLRLRLRAPARSASPPPPPSADPVRTVGDPSGPVAPTPHLAASHG